MKWKEPVAWIGIIGAAFAIKVAADNLMILLGAM